MAPMPGSMAPTPKNSTVVSLEPQTTGVPAASPVSAAAFSVTCPTTSLGLTTGGRVSIGQPISAQSSGDQDLRAVIGHERADGIAVIRLPAAGQPRAQIILGEIEPAHPVDRSRARGAAAISAWRASRSGFTRLSEVRMMRSPACSCSSRASAALRWSLHMMAGRSGRSLRIGQHRNMGAAGEPDAGDGRRGRMPAACSAAGTARQSA